MLRIIPRLDVKNDTVVKGIHLEGLRVVGKPADLAKKYYLAGADELLYMDAVASLYERNSLEDIIRQTAEEVFIPITVGGGIRTLDNIRDILRAGADKVAINTAAVKRPEFIKEAATRFGSQCIVASIEAKKIGEGQWEAYIETGRESTGVNAIEWAQQLVDLGAGEILITSIDKEGTKKGFDVELIQKIADYVPIPVIACGGAGQVEHISQLVKEVPVNAVACASLFHYDIADIGTVKQILSQQEGLKIRIPRNVEEKYCHH